ncbi:MAG: sulfite exporter TauE/SafE family protein [Chitinophagaceae bacterium]
MDVSSIYTNYELTTLVALIFFSFIGGFIDAVVGGGGLIQLPAVLLNLPNYSLPTLFGTNKIAALSGTSIAAYQYSKKVKFNIKLLAATAFCAALASYSGAQLLLYLHSNKLKPVILVVLIIIAFYTYLKKDFGYVKTKEISLNKQILYGAVIGLCVGFYDGFFGPGTGSFLVLGFVLIIGFDFLQASAYSKIINCVTNIGALMVFIKHNNYLLEIAVLMSISNIAGGFLGSKFAIKKGNQFIRKIFLLVVLIMIYRYGYDIFCNESKY